MKFLALNVTFQRDTAESSNVNRERPTNLRCFRKRYLPIVRAGVQLIRNRLKLR